MYPYALKGVENTRRFLLEWISFLHRYIPVGLLERPPQKINERPPVFRGRDDLETKMASPNCAHWIEIRYNILEWVSRYALVRLYSALFVFWLQWDAAWSCPRRLPLSPKAQGKFLEVAWPPEYVIGCFNFFCNLWLHWSPVPSWKD